MLKKKGWCIVSVMYTASEVCTVEVRQENEFWQKHRQATWCLDVEWCNRICIPDRWHRSLPIKKNWPLFFLITRQSRLTFMDPCIVVWLSRNTNKMQLCNRIYYSKVYWRLNMFRAAHRLSSGALHCICSLWFIYPCGDRLSLDKAGHHMGI
jgi:hypothetical protein